MTDRATYPMCFDTGYNELEDVPCTFLVSTETAEAPDYHPDGPSGGMDTTAYAGLHIVYLNRLELTRDQMVQMIGEKAVVEMESKAAEYYLEDAAQVPACGHPVIEVA